MPVPVPAGKPFPRTREEREAYWKQFEERNEHLGGNSQFIYPREEWQRVQDENARTLDKEFPPYGILLFLYGDAYRGKRGLFGPGRRALEASRTNESTSVDTGGHSWLTRPFKSRSSDSTIGKRKEQTSIKDKKPKQLTRKRARERTR